MKNYTIFRLFDFAFFKSFSLVKNFQKIYSTYFGWKVFDALVSAGQNFATEASAAAIIEKALISSLCAALVYAATDAHCHARMGHMHTHESTAAKPPICVSLARPFDAKQSSIILPVWKQNCSTRTYISLFTIEMRILAQL